MATKLVERISEIAPPPGGLLETDIASVSQSVNGVQTVGLTTIGDMIDYSADDIIKNGVSGIVNIGDGLTGNGTVENPIAVDKKVLDTRLIPSESIDLTQVGYRRSRYLPIARRSLYTQAGYVYGHHKFKPALCVENVGELRMIQGSDNKAYTAVISNWHADKDASSSQVFERPYILKNAVDGTTVDAWEEVISVTGNTSTASIICTRNRLSGYLTYWFCQTTIGTLKDTGVILCLRAASENPETPSLNAACTYFKNRCVSVLITKAGQWYFFTSSSTARDVEVYRVTYPASAAPVYTAVRSWVASSFAGSITTANKLTITNGTVAAAAATGVDLVVTGDSYTSTVSIVPNKPTHRFCILQGKDDPDNIHILSYLEHVITSGGVSKKFVLPIYAKITLNGVTSGTCVGVGVSLSGRPSIKISNGTFAVTNDKFLPASTDTVIESDDYYLLSDGTFAVLNDGYHGNESTFKLYAPQEFFFASLGNTDLLAGLKTYSDPITWSVKPGYVGAADVSGHKLYISSPIFVRLNKVNYHIPAQILDLNGVVAAATHNYITDIAYTDGRYKGKLAVCLYLYIEESNGIGNLQVRYTPTEETTEGTMIAAFFIPDDGSTTILYGQAYSRFGTKRLTYQPSGSAVPVSYGNPYDPPISVWGAGQQDYYSSPLVWESNAMNIPLHYAVAGTQVYVSVNPGEQYIGHTFTLTYKGTVIGAKAWTGLPLIWPVTLTSSDSSVVRQELRVSSSDPATFTAKTSLIGVVPAGISFDFVDNSNSAVADVAVGSVAKVRFTSSVVTSGSAIDCQVTTYNYVTGATTTSSLGVLTYKGSALYWTIPTSAMTLVTAKVINNSNGAVSPTKTLSVHKVVTIDYPISETLDSNDSGDVMRVIKQTVSLADYARTAVGGEPVGNFNFVIPDDVCITGVPAQFTPYNPSITAPPYPTTANTAVTVGTFPTGSKITLENNGWVIGSGGAGAMTESGAGQNGGTGIIGGNIELTVNNYGRVAGGGGGGPSSTVAGASGSVYSGGGGAPLGPGNGGQWADGTAATLYVPGHTVDRPDLNVGGTIGHAGSNSANQSAAPGSAGLAYTGSVYVINYGMGYVG